MTVRVGPDQLITEATAQATATTTRTVYVDGNRTDSYTEDGSLAMPYKTVQAAVNYVQDVLNPSHNNPALIFLAPNTPVYAEDVVIKKSGVHLAALAGQGVVRIQRLLLTNATLGSVGAFISAGGLANPTAHYGLLAADADYPWDNQFRNLAFGDPSGGDYGVYIMGVGAGTSMCGNEANFVLCTNYDKSYFRLANYIAVQGESFFRGQIEMFNCAGLWFNRSQGGSFVGLYDTASDEPSDNGNYGLCGGAGAFFYGSIQLNDEMHMGYDRLDALQVYGSLDINGTSAARMEGGFIGQNITVEGDATFRLRGVHTQGFITLDNTGGAVGCTYDGGRYMGALTDAGGRLTRNVGS